MKWEWDSPCQCDNWGGEVVEVIDSRSTNSFGADGATSLKSEMLARVATINDAASFSMARKVLMRLGGPEALCDELTFAGLVDPSLHHLTTNDVPFNVFARLAAGRDIQVQMTKEQEKLGKFQSKFLVVANLPENDRRWDSEDPEAVRTASMAKTHRFLTTKKLHWQWFNMLVYGLVPLELGGATLAEAIEEVKDMKQACLLYAKNAGYSQRVGLFVNVFGLNNVNSLFVHILDMTELGPAYASQSFKNLSLDDVLEVLITEQALDMEPPSLSLEPRQVARRQAKTKLQSRSRIRVPYSQGSTSTKEEIVNRLPVLKDAAHYREARRLLKEVLGGVEILRAELCWALFVDDETNQLVGANNVGVDNIFAQIASGTMRQNEAEQVFLGPFRSKFKVCKNRPDCDANWDSEDPKWVGNSSMSQRHRFLTTRDLHFQWFNALIFGMVDRRMDGVSVKEALEEVIQMKQAALYFASKAPGWSSDVGLYFHVFGHNNVNSLHMHIVDLQATGPSFVKNQYKNCPVDAVIKVLQEESEEEEQRLLTEIVEASSRISVEVVKVARSYLWSDDPAMSVSTRDFLNNDTMVVNVGGEKMVFSKDCFSLAAQGSMLRKIGDMDDATCTMFDNEGFCFFDFPVRAFSAIMDHLAFISCAPKNVVVPPPKLAWELQNQVRHLAWLLGVGPLMFQSQWGRSKVRPKLSRPTPMSTSKWSFWSLPFCRRRFPTPPKPDPEAPMAANTSYQSAASRA